MLSGIGIMVCLVFSSFRYSRMTGGGYDPSEFSKQNQVQHQCLDAKIHLVRFFDFVQKGLRIKMLLSTKKQKMNGVKEWKCSLDATPSVNLPSTDRIRAH